MKFKAWAPHRHQCRPRPRAHHLDHRGGVTSFDNLIAQDDNLQLRTTLFHNKVEDEIFKATGVGCQNQAVNGGTIATACPPGAMSNYRNIGGLTIKGLEVESLYNSTYLFGSVSFAYAKGQHEGAYTNPWVRMWRHGIFHRPNGCWWWVPTFRPGTPRWAGWASSLARPIACRVTNILAARAPVGDLFYDQYGNKAYNTQGLFAKWKPQQATSKAPR